MTEPMLPDSPVPRAKMTVMALQAALLVTSFAVLEPLPPVLPPPPGKPGKENVGKENAGDLLEGGSELGRAMAPAASARRSELEKSIMMSGQRNRTIVSEVNWMKRDGVIGKIG